jgi:transposase InsO family protein
MHGTRQVARGIRVGKERVRKLMQRHGIKARGKRKFVVATDSKHNLPIAPNLLERNFTPEAPNQVWSRDITYIATGQRQPARPAMLVDAVQTAMLGWCDAGYGRAPMCLTPRCRLGPLRIRRLAF